MCLEILKAHATPLTEFQFLITREKIGNYASETPIFKTEISNFEFKNLYNSLYISVQSLHLRKLVPFDWKCLQIGTLRAKNLKNAPILQEGGSNPVPPTSPVIRVVLLHK